MQVSVTFRKLEATDAIKEYAQEKVRKIKKYFPDPIQIHMVLSQERYQHRADVNIKLHNGLLLKAAESSDNMYGSIDLAMSKIERQVRRYKDRIRDHKPHAHPQASAAERRAFREQAEALEEAEEAQSARSGSPLVIRSDKFLAEPMTVEQAVTALNSMNNAFLVFTNSTSNAINVVYRRTDGNYGLIDPSENPVASL